MNNQNRKTLVNVANGQTVTLVSVNAGYGLKNRLASMGLVPNVRFTVLNNGHPGPFLINIKGTKTVIGKGVAGKIIVQ